jgi:hypothetical protein
MKILERLEELEKKATTAPWLPSIDSLDAGWAAICPYHPTDDKKAINDAQFVAALRNAAPALLAVARAANDLVKSEWCDPSFQRHLEEALQSLAEGEHDRP